MNRPMQKKLYETTIATTVSIIILVIAFYPAVFQGQIIYLEDPPGSDSLGLNIPRRYLAVQSLLKYGEFPLWEPRIGCGAPLFAESEAGVLHPSILFFFLNNITLANNLTIFSALLIAMLGSYAWSRCLGLEPLPAAISGIIYGLGTTFLAQTQLLNIIHVFALLPVSLALIHLGAANKSKFIWFGLIIVWACQLHASHFETFTICQMCCWIYILWLSFIKNEYIDIPRKQLLLFALLSLFAAVLIGAAQLLTTYEFAQQSTRSAAASLDWCQRTSTSIEPIRFIDPFYPMYKPGQEILLEKFYTNGQYIGIFAVLLCIFSFIGKRKREVIQFFTIALFFFITALGPNYGIFYLFWRYVPFMNSFRFPNRYATPMVCILAMIAAIGAQELSDRIKNRYSRHTAEFTLCLLLFCICAEHIWIAWQTQGYLPSSWSNPPCVLKDSVQHGRIFSLYSYKQNLIEIHANKLSRQQRQNIIWRYRSLLSPGMIPLWDMEAPDDYVFYGGGIVLTDSANFQTSIHAVANLMLQADPAHINNISPKYDDWLALFGVSHLISPFPLPAGWPQSEFSDIYSVPIAEIPKEQVYVYTLAKQAKRIRLVPRLQTTIPKDALDLEALSGQENNILFSLGTNDAGSLYEPDIARPADIGQTAIEQATNHSLTVQTSCEQDAHLVISNTYDKNWQATVDGRPVKVQLTNLSMQSLPIPKGRHRIKLHYISPAFELGWKISLISFILFIAALTFVSIKAKLNTTN